MRSIRKNCSRIPQDSRISGDVDYSLLSKTRYELITVTHYKVYVRIFYLSYNRLMIN